MKAGLYARVSTDEQTLDQQLEELRRVAEARGYEAIEYVDHGLSGALPEHQRPSLQRMMKDAERGKIKVVICWDVSRLGRSVQIVVNLVERMHKYGTKFTTLRDNIDTTTAQGEFQFHVFAAMAQLMRKMISENTKAKLNLLKKKGVVLGRPAIGVRQSKPQVNADDVIRYAAANKDLTLREIGKHFKIGKSTVGRILSQKGVLKTAPIIVGKEPVKAGSI